MTTALFHRAEWGAVASDVLNAPPVVVFGCRFCRAPLRYDGTLTADGYGLTPITCPKCWNEYGVLFQGWPERAVVVVPRSLCQADGDAR